MAAAAAESPVVVGSSRVAMSPVLSAERLPPRGFTFDAPPIFDTRTFEEEGEGEAFIGGGGDSKYVLVTPVDR